MNKIYTTNLEKISADQLEGIRKQYSKDVMSLLEVNEEDAKHITEKTTAFLRDYCKNFGFKGYVIGLSGGIDSSISATLAVKAVGKEKVYGMLLPSKFTAQNHINDALEVAKKLGIRVNDFEKVKQYFDSAIELTMLMTEVDKTHPNHSMLLGNNHARERMKTLRGKAASLNYLVLGTTNRTEAWLGYATIAGDGYKGVDIEPILMLPKTSERKYAKFIGIPEQVIAKAPTAGLWEGQTDEGEIGMTYEDIDRVMTGKLIGLNAQEIEFANKKPSIHKKSIETIISRAKSNEFKAIPEPFADLGRLQL